MVCGTSSLRWVCSRACDSYMGPTINWYKRPSISGRCNYQPHEQPEACQESFSYQEPLTPICSRLLYIFQYSIGRNVWCVTQALIRSRQIYIQFVVQSDNVLGNSWDCIRISCKCLDLACGYSYVWSWQNLVWLDACTYGWQNMYVMKNKETGIKKK